MLKRSKPARPFWFALTGFFASLGALLIPHLLPALGIHPLFVMASIAALFLLAGWLILKMSRKGAVFPDMHQLALASGVMLLYLLLAPIWEFAATRRRNMTGMTVVAGLAALLFLWIARRIKTRDEPPP